MMAEFPPNLDDGELWLPAEITPDLGVRPHSRVDAFAGRRLAAFALLDRAHLFATPNTTANFEVSFSSPISSLGSLTPPLYRFRPVRTRFVPVGRAGFGFAPVKPVHPLRRRSQPQGTGVFLPRVMVDGKLENNYNERGGGQVEMPRQACAELALPQDWSY